MDVEADGEVDMEELSCMLKLTRWYEERIWPLSSTAVRASQRTGYSVKQPMHVILLDSDGKGKHATRQAAGS